MKFTEHRPAATVLASYLRALRDMETVKSCLLSLDGQTFAACHYVQTRNTPDSCDAYRAGERLYKIESFYVLGVQPKRVAAHKHICGGEYCCKYLWRLAGDERDWYGGGYCRVQTENPGWMAQYGEFHPFGSHWSLNPWSEGPNYRGDVIGPIDQYDTVKRVRLPFSVEYLEESA